MASGCPPPFGDPGEMREGFLCPLCLKDLQSFYQLQAHYEEEHSGEDRDVKGQLKSKSRGCTSDAVAFAAAHCVRQEPPGPRALGARRTHRGEQL